MELIDVLLPDGTPAGSRKTKDEVHRDGDWHRSVHVWIMTPDGQLLLQRRSLAKENHPGLWDISAAGHLESASAANIRCLRASTSRKRAACSSARSCSRTGPRGPRRACSRTRGVIGPLDPEVRDDAP